LTSLSKLPFKQWLSNRTSRKQLWVVCTASVAVLIAAYSFYGVRVEASVDRDGLAVRCGPNAQIMVIVHNYTFHRLAGASLTLEGWRDGRSNNILAHSRFHFDTVTGPFRTSSQCLPDDAFAITEGNATAPTKEETQEEMVRFSTSQMLAEINELKKVTSGVTIVVREVEPEFY
jgi:hypothetical protein